MVPLYVLPKICRCKLFHRAFREGLLKAVVFCPAIDLAARKEGSKHRTAVIVQAEGQRLTAESAKRQLEAQIASLKRDTAQAVAAQKAADASWQAQVDSHRAEVCLDKAREYYFMQNRQLDVRAGQTHMTTEVVVLLSLSKKGKFGVSAGQPCKAGAAAIPGRTGPRQGGSAQVTPAALPTQLIQHLLCAVLCLAAASGPSQAQLQRDSPASAPICLLSMTFPPKHGQQRIWTPGHFPCLPHDEPPRARTEAPVHVRGPCLQGRGGQE